MADENTRRLEQRMELSVGNPRLSRDLIAQYVGKEVVLESDHIGTNVSSGFLEKYDGKRVKIKDFKQHDMDLDDSIEWNPRNYVCQRDVDSKDITNPASVRYTLPSRTINAHLIASIQTMEDVLNARGK